MIRWKQKSMGFMDFGLNYKNPNFIKLAESYGVNGYRLEKHDNAAEKISALINATGITLLEVPIEY